MGIRRFSSRTERLDKEFLSKALEGAVKYYRIAGYFRSSVFELVGEEIARIPEVKIVCNSELDLLDFQVATGRETALKERWNEVDVEAESMLCKERYRHLDELLRAGNVEIRVVPKERLFLQAVEGYAKAPSPESQGFTGPAEAPEGRAVPAGSTLFPKTGQRNGSSEMPADHLQARRTAVHHVPLPAKRKALSKIH